MKKRILIAFSICICYPIYSQIALQKLTDEMLADKGLTLYKSHRYIEALPYLYAYYQNNYEALKQSKSSIEKCLQFIEGVIVQTDEDKQSLYQLKKELKKCKYPNDPIALSQGLEHSGPELTLLIKKAQYNTRIENSTMGANPNEVIKPSKAKKAISSFNDVTISNKKEGQIIYSAEKDTKGLFTVAWSRLSLVYNGSYLDYEIDLNINFPGCTWCNSQIVLWVDDDHAACISETSADNQSVSRKGRIVLPRSLATNGALDIYLISALGNNCSDVIKKNGCCHAGQEIVGTIPRQ